MTKQRQQLRVTYLAMSGPNDRTSWSGTHYYMAQALQQRFADMYRVGPLAPFAAKVGKVIQHGVYRLTGQRYLYAQTNSLSRKLAEHAQCKLAEHPCDLVFAPSGSGILGHLKSTIPIVYLSDATVRLLIDYYTEFTNVLPSHIAMADKLERAAIKKAARLIYPSSWAARSAIEDYGANPEKVHVIPFGANLDVTPRADELVPLADEKCCRLLFVGVNWARKGGDIAFQTLLELERMGVCAELTVVGCRPPRHITHPHLRVFEFLDKNDPIQRVQLSTLYRQATFFLLPSRAECFSIALCEANAYGLPVVTTDTGGLSELVQEGENGMLLALSAGGGEYAVKIRDVYRDAEMYQALRISSRKQFETRLNWNVWAERVAEVFVEAVDNGRGSRGPHPDTRPVMHTA